MEEVQLGEFGLESNGIVVCGTEDDKGTEVDETEEHAGVGSAFAAWGKHASTVVFVFDRGIFEDGFVHKFGILGKVEVGTDEDTREVEAVMKRCVN